MKILIDTNVVIHLEDNKIIDDAFSLFYNLAITNNCKILYHPNAIPKDIERDKDSFRQEVIQSKLKKYEVLEDACIPTPDFLAKLKNNKINDKIDNMQLYQLYRGFVDYFITEDKGIHSKSKKLDLEDKVMTVQEALFFLEEKFTIKIPTHPILKGHSLREIENLFSTSFFNSLREDYGNENFDNWLSKCIIDNRRCYSLIVDGELKALLIYNVESVEDHKIPSVYDRALKICTLKVDNSAFGIKLGELFLNKMFQYCINQGIKYLYLTVYDKQFQLINLLENFGFIRQEFTNSIGCVEIRMIKCMDKGKIDTCCNDSFTHPFYNDNKERKKFVIPIQPQFYKTLFKDGKLRQPTLFDKSLEYINEIQGNTIYKAYISHSKITSLKHGDILFFYSSKSSQVIEPVGILESFKIVDNFDDLWEMVQKKTVFSQDDLKTMLSEKGKLHVITFRLITYLDNHINLNKIKNIGSFRNKIVTITQLKEEDYIELKNDGHFNERYIINQAPIC